MSDDILGGDIRVYYLAENRQKRIEWIGAAADTRSSNEVYSAAADLMDDLTQMDDGSIMSAQTPTEYTIGSIDPSDDEPWFIDRTTAEHLTGGALITSGWQRAEGTNTGIIKMGYTETVGLVTGDIGKTIVHTDGDTGTLLDYNEDTFELWIRPLDNTATHSFPDTPSANGSWTITGGTGTGNQAGGVATSAGESLWSNAFTLGAIVVESHLYMYQNALKVTTYKGATPDDWWADGQIDVLIPVQILDSTPVDEGYITVFARQYGSTYSHFVSDVSAGGRNPLPLAAGGDLDNTTEWRTFTGNTGNNTFEVGNWMYVGASWAAATVKALIMAVGGTSADPVLGYTLLGDLTDFVVSDAVTEYIGTGDGDADCIAANPTNAGPAAGAAITMAHANTGVDVDEDGTDERYSIAVDLLTTEAVGVGYEFSKYETKRGTVTTDTTDGITGESYIGNEYRIAYGGSSGTIAEGTVVTQVSTLATGTVVANHTTADILVLRNTRGTFDNSNQIDEGGNNVTSPTSVAITPINAAPFGTFAGGTWFCAPGVVLINVPAADANNYQLVDDSGNVVTAPTKVNITVSNTRALDRITVFRLTAAGGIIEKDEFAATVMSAGDTDVVVSGAIPADVPGLSTGGALRIVDASSGIEYRLRYATYVAATGTFNLAATSSDTTEAGGNGTTTTKITATGAFTTSQIGDLIRNQTRSNAISYISNLVDANEVDIFPAIAAQVATDTFDINVVPVLTTTSDDVYVPLIDKHETTGSDGSPGSEVVNVTYLADIDALVRVRQSGDILPFETPSTVNITGASVATIRTTDTIHT